MRPVHLAGAVALLAISVTDAAAQAWVGPQGSLDIDLDYNLGISDTVVTDDGNDFPDAGTTTQQITLGAEYAPIPKLAVTVAIPFAMLKYTGDPNLYPHPGGGRYDDGDYHATLTDFRAGARYQVLEEPVAISPSLAFSIPMADYESVGNTVGGRHLKALHAGISVGRVIGDATYVHLAYEFSLVEKYDRTPETAQHSQNRSDLGFSVGHKLLDFKLDIHADLNMRRTHGGVSFSEFPTLSESELMYHDPILDEDILLLGGGVGYQLTDSLNVAATAALFVAGQNTQNANVFALSVGWSAL